MPKRYTFHCPNLQVFICQWNLQPLNFGYPGSKKLPGYPTAALWTNAIQGYSRGGGEILGLKVLGKRVGVGVKSCKIRTRHLECFSSTHHGKTLTWRYITHELMYEIHIVVRATQNTNKQNLPKIPVIRYFNVANSNKSDNLGLAISCQWQQYFAIPKPNANPQL